MSCPARDYPQGRQPARHPELNGHEWLLVETHDHEGRVNGQYLIQPETDESVPLWSIPDPGPVRPVRLFWRSLKAVCQGVGRGYRFYHRSCEAALNDQAPTVTHILATVLAGAAAYTLLRLAYLQATGTGP
jgi:hypothetical protein